MDVDILFQLSKINRLSETPSHVTIFLPFEPKMKPKADIIASLKYSFIKVKRDLEKNCQEDMALLILEKLKTIIRELDFSTHKKSIAIFLSPVFEKVLYLDILINPKVCVGGSFKIEDLVDHKKKNDEYLAAFLTSNKIQVFLGSPKDWKTIVSASPESFYTDHDQKVVQAHVVDSRKYDKSDLHSFIGHASGTLDILMNAYDLPLFFIASSEIIKNYQRLSRGADPVTCFINLPGEEINEVQIKTLLEPMLNNWRQIEDDYILNKLRQSATRMDLAMGIKDVWNKAMSHRGKLLVVEKDFRYTATPALADQLIFKAVTPYNKFSYINDPIDNIMEKVFENGGDVEFVENGFLTEYHGIALI